MCADRQPVGDSPVGFLHQCDLLASYKTIIPDYPSALCYTFRLNYALMNTTNTKRDLIVRTFTQHTLNNGLQMILKEVHTVPVISWWVAYRVGSRNEPTGQTGISHWVEHMMFKGTEAFPAGVLDREIDRIGGQWNAFTSMDYTMYYETVPADHIDLAMRAERDRMMNAQFDPEETESERTVIISERQGNENSPMFWLKEAMLAAAFRVHGYHHPIIGDMSDLETMTRDDLFQHYQRHYHIGNAVIVAVGAFDTPELIAKIEDIYGDLPPCEPPQLFSRPEPAPQGERRVTIERPGTTAFLSIAHHAPAAKDPDWFALEVLDSVLTGPGGGVDNKTSRLYRQLVKTGIAVSVGGGLAETIDPYLYTISATLNDGHSPDEAEAIILAEIERIHDNGITPAELDKAKKQAKAAFAYATESMTNQAYWLAQSAILGDVAWFDGYLGRLMAVTVEDVLAAARRYLISRNRVVGHLLPVMPQLS